MQIEEPEPNKKSLKQIPWVEKYRPSNLQEIIAHEEIISTIRKFQQENKLPNLLLYGPPGTGKTSTIIALAKEVYGKQYSQMVLELNASNERGIQTVRETIKRFAESQSLSFTKQKQVKLIILDEADAMTSAAQFALRRSIQYNDTLQKLQVIEKFSKNTRFCFICNYVSKIIPALQSRCTRFKFKQIPKEQSSKRILEICQYEGLNISRDGVNAIFNLCDGDMRRIVNMIQGSNDSQEIINQRYVYSFTGMADPQKIQQIFDILTNTCILQQANDEINQILIDFGISVQLLLKELNAILLGIDMPDRMKIFLVQRMAEIEYRLSLNCSNQLQLQSLISSFFESRQLHQQN